MPVENSQSAPRVRASRLRRLLWDGVLHHHEQPDGRPAGTRLDAAVIDVFLRVLEAYRQADPDGFAANFIAQREFEDVESGKPTVYAGGQSG